MEQKNKVMEGDASNDEARRWALLVAASTPQQAFDEEIDGLLADIAGALGEEETQGDSQQAEPRETDMERASSLRSLPTVGLFPQGTEPEEPMASSSTDTPKTKTAPKTAQKTEMMKETATASKTAPTTPVLVLRRPHAPAPIEEQVRQVARVQALHGTRRTKDCGVNRFVPIPTATPSQTPQAWDSGHPEPRVVEVEQVAGLEESWDTPTRPRAQAATAGAARKKAKPYNPRRHLQLSDLESSVQRGWSRELPGEERPLPGPQHCVRPGVTPIPFDDTDAGDWTPIVPGPSHQEWTTQPPAPEPPAPTRRGSQTTGRWMQETRTQGILFPGLTRIPTDPEVDPPPYTCFNCWAGGHSRRDCPLAPRRDFCINCCRTGVTLTTCPRCKDANERRLASQFGAERTRRFREERTRLGSEGANRRLDREEAERGATNRPRPNYPTPGDDLMQRTSQLAGALANLPTETQDEIFRQIFEERRQRRDQ